MNEEKKQNQLSAKKILSLIPFAVVTFLICVIIWQSYKVQTERLGDLTVSLFAKVLRDQHEEIATGYGLKDTVYHEELAPYRNRMNEIIDDKTLMHDTDFLKTKTEETLTKFGEDEWAWPTKLIELHQNKYDRAESVQFFTNWGFRLSIIIYVIIGFLAIRLLLFWFSHFKLNRDEFNVSIEHFNDSMGFEFLHPFVDKVSFYRQKVIEIEDNRLDKEESLSNLLVRIGLIGTLFGLAMAFYTAASSFPQDAGAVYRELSTKEQVVTGLIQTIMNYSFAIVTSLAAYSLAFCLHIIGSVFRQDSNYIQHFDDIAGGILAGVVPVKNPLWGKIEEILERIDVEGQIESFLKEMKEELSKQLNEVKLKIEELNTHLSSMQDDVKGRSIKEKLEALEQEITDLKDAIARINKKLTAIDEAASRKYE